MHGNVRTALDEYLVEALQYAVSQENQVHLHVTVSRKQKKRIESFMQVVIPELEIRFGLSYFLDISEQKVSTYAADLTPLRSIRSLYWHHLCPGASGLRYPAKVGH